MSVLTPRAHGYLDYLTVVLFAGAPSVLALSGLPATLAYVLAAVHLVLTLVTHFPLGVAKLVPLPAHGAIELIVAVALVALPWLLGFAGDETARWFYVVMGIVIFVVWLLSRYKR
jgi:SPW repeat